MTNRDSPPPNQVWTLRYARADETDGVRALERYAENKVMMRKPELVRAACSLNNVLVIDDPAGELSACAMLFPVGEDLNDLALTFAAQLDNGGVAQTERTYAYEAAHLCASPEARKSLEIGPLMHLVRLQVAVAEGMPEPMIWNVLANNGNQIHVLEKRVGVERLKKRSGRLEKGLRARIEKYIEHQKTLPESKRWLTKMPTDLDDAVITYAAPPKEGRFFAQRLSGVLAAFVNAPPETGSSLRIEGEMLRHQLSTTFIEAIARETDVAVAAPWHRNDLLKN